MAQATINNLLSKLGLSDEDVEGLRHKPEFLLALAPFLDYDELNYKQIALMQKLNANQVSKHLCIARRKQIIQKVRRVSSKRHKFWIYTLNLKRATTLNV